VPGGHVSIRWRRLPATEGYGVEIWWDEEGGPKVKQPKQRGFGTMVIEQNLTRSLDAEVTLDFNPAGLSCRIVIPVMQLSIGR
jgi:two-component sensor histidine kinase